MWKTFLYKKTFRHALIDCFVLKLSDSYYTIAHNLIAMIVQKLPYILFRSYSSYGYLTDNRNFGYDTASHSCKKVGELILSNTGKP